jgi:putative RNA 2'-phosphotransferase
MRDKNELSKAISHALRHEPEEYGIKLDKDGWIELKILIEALKAKSNTFPDLSENDICLMVEQAPKKRHEINDQRIRAVYGHSTDVEIEYPEQNPPLKLYHGTSKDNSKVILLEGLKPMSRQYVHLTSSVDGAFNVGSRKDKEPVILEIDAYKASLAGIKFYLAGENIWLSKVVPAEFIHILSKDGT